MLRNTKQHFYMMLRGILRSKITNKKHKSVENLPLSIIIKGLLFTVRAGKKGTVSPCSTSAGNAHQDTQIFHSSACVWMTTKVPQVLILGLQINANEQVSLQICSPQTMRINSILSLNIECFLDASHCGRKVTRIDRFLPRCTNSLVEVGRN